MSIDSQSIQYIQKLVRDFSANIIPDEKSYLINLRLTELARKEGFDSVQGFIGYLRDRPLGLLHSQVAEAMMNSETSFFRESRTFEAVEKCVLPALLKERQMERSLNIWSAACSSGQEPYSIAMHLHEHLPDIAQWDVQIVASEYSESILAVASQGSYSNLTINRGLPSHMLQKYFDKSSVEDNSQAIEEWQIKDHIRKMVTFQRLNLAKPWPTLPQMDIIFLRNILIYLHEETKNEILDRVSALLKPDGYLFLGSAETISNLHSSFERVQIERTVAYRLRSHESRNRNQQHVVNSNY